MKKIFLGLLLLTLTQSLFAQTTTKSFEGNWFLKDMDNSTINIYKAVDGYWYGKITKSDNTKFVGKLMFSKLIYNSKDNTFKGTITKPSNNTDANATPTLADTNTLTITAKKYFMTKTFTLKKV